MSAHPDATGRIGQLSSPAARAQQLLRLLGLVDHPHLEARLVRFLIGKGWSPDAAHFAASCARWWAANGQQYPPPGPDEPQVDVLDLAQLAEHVAGRA